MKQLTCNSCKKVITNLEGSTIFKCPSCLKHDIVRCGNCRSIAAKYNCECGFTGPN